MMLIIGGTLQQHNHKMYDPNNILGLLITFVVSMRGIARSLSKFAR